MRKDKRRAVNRIILVHCYGNKCSGNTMKFLSTSAEVLRFVFSSWSWAIFSESCKLISLLVWRLKKNRSYISSTLPVFVSKLSRSTTAWHVQNIYQLPVVKGIWNFTNLLGFLGRSVMTSSPPYNDFEIRNWPNFSLQSWRLWALIVSEAMLKVSDSFYFILYDIKPQPLLVPPYDNPLVPGSDLTIQRVKESLLDRRIQASPKNAETERESLGRRKKYRLSRKLLPHQQPCDDWAS